MSYLADELERQLSQSGQSIDDLVPKTNISRAQLYLWKRGEQTSITEEQLNSLAPALSDDVHDHAALIKAHLLDERFGPGCDLITIEVEHGGTLRDRPKPRSKGEQALIFLAEERVRNRDLNDLLIDLARMLGAFDKVSSDAAAEKADVSADTGSKLMDILKKTGSPAGGSIPPKRH